MAIVEVLFLTIFWTWTFTAVLFLRNTFVPRLPLAPPPDSLTASVSSISFPATDGVRLEGWRMATTSPEHPWIILCHGLGANRSDLLEIADGLRAEGFNLLLFDFRGHGTSSGRTSSFGWAERRDLEGALAYLGSQPEVPVRPVGVYGISMGASVALLVAADDERIGVIVADSPYRSLEASIARHMKLLYPWLPRWPFVPMALATYRLRFGVWPGAVSPEHGVAALGSRPLLLINGAEDPRMPADEIRTMAARAHGPVTTWVVPGADHLGAYHHNPRAYVDRLVGVFRSGLNPRPRGRT